VVVLEATIDADGRVVDAKVLRSIPLLDQAAIDAVKQWMYEPTLVNGVAVPVIMTVTVSFSMLDPTSLKITDRSGIVTMVTNPIVQYGVAIDVANPGTQTVTMSDGLRAFRGNAEVNVKWSLVDTITFDGIVADRPSRLKGTVVSKTGDRTALEFPIPAAGGMLRGKTSGGDYAIAVKDIATISPVSIATRSTGSNADPGTQRPDGSYVPGKTVTYPRALREVHAQYTSEAMKAGIQGEVFLECVVRPDGTVGDVRIARSLDPTFGLDEAAVKAAKQWKFQPGMRDGVAVPVLVTIEMTFTLGKR
jgi:protein TonB